MLEGMNPVKKKPCRIVILAAEMSETDRQIFFNAVDDYDGWPANTLSKELSKRGVKVADTTITKHRLRLCVCFRN